MKSKKKVLSGGPIQDQTEVKKALIALRKFDLKGCYQQLHNLTAKEPGNVTAFILKIYHILDYLRQVPSPKYPYRYPEDMRKEVIDFAREKATEIAEYEPSNAYAWYVLGLAEYLARNKKEAKEAFGKFSSLNPGDLAMLHQINRIWELPREIALANRRAKPGNKVDSQYYKEILKKMNKFGLDDNALKGMIAEEDPEIFNDERVKSLMQAPVSPRKTPEIQLEDIPPLDIVIPQERVITIPQEQIDAARLEKEKGNQAYKNREFQVALERYEAASDLDPTDVLFLANKAAVYVELNDFNAAKAQCQIALKLAKQFGCSRQMFAKLYSRLGNCEKGYRNYFQAIKLYKTSLVADPGNVTVQKNRDVCIKRLKEERRRQRWNAEEFENELRQAIYLADEQRYLEAIEAFNEAEICLPENNKEYQKNRTRLLLQRGRVFLCMFDVRECLADALAAIEIGKLNADAWLLKAAALECDKMYDQASNAFQTALKIQATSEEAKRGLKRCLKASFQVRNNPTQLKLRKKYNENIMEILADPKIKALLKDPSLRDQSDYLRNPEMVEKVQTLIDVGIIKMRSAHSEVYPQHNLDPDNPILVLQKNAHFETHDDEPVQESSEVQS